MKGQVFILTAFVICVMLAGLGNIYTYSSLPAQTEQTKIADTIDLLKNIQDEIIFVDSISYSDENMFDDLILFIGNFTEQKNYNISYASVVNP